MGSNPIFGTTAGTVAAPPAEQAGSGVPRRLESGPMKTPRSLVGRILDAVSDFGTPAGNNALAGHAAPSVWNRERHLRLCPQCGDPIARDAHDCTQCGWKEPDDPRVPAAGDG